MATTSETCTDVRAQQPASWKEPCSEHHLAVISDAIADWRAVSPFLGLTEAEEIAILGSNPHSVPVQKIAMLRKWKQKHGAKATYKRLCRVFDDCKRADLVDMVKQLLAESNNSSSDEEGTIERSLTLSTHDPLNKANEFLLPNTNNKSGPPYLNDFLLQNPPMPHSNVASNVSSGSQALVSNFQPPVVKRLLNYRKNYKKNPEEYEGEEKWSEKAVKSLIKILGEDWRFG